MKSNSVQVETVISPSDFERRRRAGGVLELVDVRTAPEFNSAHVSGARLIPLDQLDPEMFMKNRVRPDEPIYLICQSGSRAARAAAQFRKAGYQHCVLVEGGTQAWIDAGLPVDRGHSRVLPLMRQVQIVIGFVSALGSALALGIDVRFAVAPLVMGAGLLFAGLTGTCGLAMLLARMPWNRESVGGSQSCTLPSA